VAKNVKPLPARVEQARTRLARAAVVTSARQLFLERGYAATTLQAISAAADVPEPTLYRLFSSKIGVLKAVLDVAAGGDDQEVSFGDRPDVRARLELDDAQALLSAFAELAAQVMQRVAPIQQMLVGAAATDTEAAHLLADFTRQRQQGQARIAQSLRRRGALRRGLSEQSAADTVFTLMSPEVYRLLTVDCDLTPRQYRRWLADALRRQLLV
jgi:AcrR family transcriptional regulator